MSICETYTVQLQSQCDLKTVGAGASGEVYKVDDQIALKACRTFERPGSEASKRDHWHYASDTLFHNTLLANERMVLRLLQKRPHHHIVEPLDRDQPEGVYLRKQFLHSLTEFDGNVILPMLFSILIALTLGIEIYRWIKNRQ